MVEAILDAWDEPAEAKPSAAAKPVATEPHPLKPPHPKLLPAPVEVIEAPQAHCAPARLEFSQSLAMRPGDPAAEDRLAAQEDEVFARNLQIVDDMTYWADVEPGTKEPPDEWVQSMGRDAARRRLRVATASCMSLKDAPIGISAAKSIVSSLAKARAVRDVGRGGLQINIMAIFPTNVTVYDELVVKDE
jgi:hypothetical protein